MRASAIGAVLAVALAGCGGGVPGEEANGTWYADFGSTCGAMVTFDAGAKSYVAQLLCTLADGTVGDELEAGDATFADGKVTQVPRRSSCPTSDHSTETDRYSRSGSSLTILSDSGAIIMEAVDTKAAGGGTAIVRFGCWNMGRLEPHPVQDL